MVSGQSMFSELRRIPHYLRKAPQEIKAGLPLSALPLFSISGARAFLFPISRYGGNGAPDRLHLSAYAI